jgi:hypothetical protein
MNSLDPIGDRSSRLILVRAVSGVKRVDLVGSHLRSHLALLEAERRRSRLSSSTLEHLPQDYREMLSQSDRIALLLLKSRLSSSTRLQLLEVPGSGKAIASTPKNL